MADLERRLLAHDTQLPDRLVIATDEALGTALRVAERFQHRWGVRAREGGRSRAREGLPVEAEPGRLP